MKNGCSVNRLSRKNGYCSIGLVRGEVRRTGKAHVLSDGVWLCSVFVASSREGL